MDNKLVSSVRTSALRVDLDEAGVPPMTDDEVFELSLKFNNKLDELEQGDGKQGGWVKLFKEMSNDGAGLITYDQVRELAHRKLIKNKEVSEQKLQLLWCWLDNDNSDTLVQVEFARFMNMAGPGALKAGKDAAGRRRSKRRQSASARLRRRRQSWR